MDKNKGFTLIEFIVVVSIVLLFLGAALPNYNQFSSQVKLKSEAKKMIDVFELAKKKALSADLSDKSCTNFTGYRTTVTAAAYSLNFCCAGSCSDIQDYNLGTNITVTSGIGNYNFTPLMILPDFVSNSIRLKDSALSKCIDISISPIGVIELNETLISC
jgi:prepilin-type N-terminal cleavage/methylation domain-containing protein